MVQEKGNLKMAKAIEVPVCINRRKTSWFYQGITADGERCACAHRSPAAALVCATRRERNRPGKGPVSQFKAWMASAAKTNRK